MTIEEAINILIAVAVCSTEYLYCDEHCPFYHPEGVRICNEWNDEMVKEAVETVSALRQQDVPDKDVGKNEPLTNAQKIRAMTDDEMNELFHEIYNAGAEDAVAYEWGQRTNSFEWTMEWLQMPAGEEDDHE